MGEFYASFHSWFCVVGSSSLMGQRDANETTAQ